MMLKRKTKEIARGSQKSSLFGHVQSKKVNRRGFLKGSGIAVGGLAAFSFAGGTVTPADASAVDSNMSVMKSVCTHCSVGCTVLAEVRNGVWVGQEPGWDSPFNLGAHCAKGAAVR